MNVFRLGRELEVHKLHVLASSEADVPHEGLQESLSAGLANCQRPRYDCVENIRLLDAASDVEELEERVEVLDVVDAETSCQSSSRWRVCELTSASL